MDTAIYSFFQDKFNNRIQTSGALTRSEPINLRSIIEQIVIPPLATRWASHEVLNAIADYLPSMIVGSADLSSSDGTFLKNSDFVSKNQFEGKNIKYGVREFAMACIAAGMAQTGLVFPVVGTFLAFADYMRSAMRMISHMGLKVVFHLTHDSIFVGHDGPTHQPIEQLSSLRGMPGLLVIRPADSLETKAAWVAASGTSRTYSDHFV